MAGGMTVRLLCRIICFSNYLTQQGPCTFINAASEHIENIRGDCAFNSPASSVTVAACCDSRSGVGVGFVVFINYLHQPGSATQLFPSADGFARTSPRLIRLEITRQERLMHRCPFVSIGPAGSQLQSHDASGSGMLSITFA
ncbi:hypothetical protein AAFF_G00432340 [Aldrovandia affinis]|uniref:Uncharacterized protein n=1 Tax=Aldrovandia affinis TaxID=143900 RepID=A0AAD7WI73_9TELE|nr:hypothetical protein AAFF_G00432340 [Aldrovandia affinis]